MFDGLIYRYLLSVVKATKAEAIAWLENESFTSMASIFIYIALRNYFI